MTSISPKNEDLLRQLVSTGRFQSEDAALTAALRLLQEQSLVETEGTVHAELKPKFASRDKWLEEFHNWVNKPRQGNPNMDDSRESIYGDRGL